MAAASRSDSGQRLDDPAKGGVDRIHPVPLRRRGQHVAHALQRKPDLVAVGGKAPLGHLDAAQGDLGRAVQAHEAQRGDHGDRLCKLCKGIAAVCNVAIDLRVNRIAEQGNQVGDGLDGVGHAGRASGKAFELRLQRQQPDVAAALQQGADAGGFGRDVDAFGVEHPVFGPLPAPGIHAGNDIAVRQPTDGIEIVIDEFAVVARVEVGAAGLLFRNRCRRPIEAHRPLLPSWGLPPAIVWGTVPRSSACR